MPIPESGTDPALRVSATVLTRDSARHLPGVLAALAWCDEVVVLDTGSTDETIALAARHANVAVHVLPGPFPGFGEARRQAVALARNDWILSIDSDEVVSPELAEEVRRLGADSKTVYRIRFDNYFNGRRIFSCGWSPDYHERLFDRTATGFSADKVHERIQTSGLTVRTLEGAIRHYSYAGVDDFLRKMRGYSALFASQYAGRRSVSPGGAFARGLWAFVRSYVVQRGFLQGYEGLVISAYKGQTTFWKYIYLFEANGREANERA